MIESCPKCGYDLAGIELDLCPECGGNILELERARIRRSHRYPLLLFGICLLLWSYPAWEVVRLVDDEFLQAYMALLSFRISLLVLAAVPFGTTLIRLAQGREFRRTVFWNLVGYWTVLSCLIAAFQYAVAIGFA